MPSKYTIAKWVNALKIIWLPLTWNLPDDVIQNGIRDLVRLCDTSKHWPHMSVTYITSRKQLLRVPDMWKYRWWSNCMEGGFRAHHYTRGIYGVGPRQWIKCLCVSDHNHMGEKIVETKIVRSVDTYITAVFNVLKIRYLFVANELHSGWLYE